MTNWKYYNLTLTNINNVIKNGILGFTETKEALRQVVKNAYMNGNQSWLDASH